MVKFDARSIAVNLIPHITSVHNVALIKSAVETAVAAETERCAKMAEGAGQCSLADAMRRTH